MVVVVCVDTWTTGSRLSTECAWWVLAGATHFRRRSSTLGACTCARGHDPAIVDTHHLGAPGAAIAGPILTVCPHFDRRTTGPLAVLLLPTPPPIVPLALFGFFEGDGCQSGSAASAFRLLLFLGCLGEEEED